MLDFPLLYLVYLALGAVVGVLAGMLGIGGGLIIVPALLYVFLNELSIPLQLAMPMAIATSLSTIILTSMSSALAHYKLGNIRRYLVVWCALGIGVGALLGPQIATRLAADDLKSVFAVLVILIALQMVFMKPKKSDKQITIATLIIIGIVTGIISAFMGIGGGALMVPALIWFRVDIRHAIGCAAFCGLIIAVFGSLSFIQAGWFVENLPAGSFGYIYLPAALGIVITSIFTARLGAKISHHLDTQRLKHIFAGFLVIVSLRMLLG
ncbi:sulfite exporter TauE/SafE family protein [Aliiglaciecola litoralis]|uniref:Probable membrane transporter protein n=1 Tax=Aliiglaciecola litoralis TaxID=582857 RepID=A0ABP3WP96_9ALTE